MEKDLSHDEEKSLAPQQSTNTDDATLPEPHAPIIDESTILPQPATPITASPDEDKTTSLAYPSSQPTLPPIQSQAGQETISPATNCVQPPQDYSAAPVQPSTPVYVPGPFPPANPNYTQNYNPYPNPVNGPMPNYAPHPQRPPRSPKRPGKLAQPLSLWTFLGAIILVMALMVVLHLTGSDWADGALHASYAALIIGIILVLALIIRSIDGMGSSLNPTRTRQQVISITCILLIFIYSFTAQALQPTLHISQGHSLENQQQWQQAIKEYTLGGEHPPTGVNLARTYTSWGLALSKQQNYSEASTKLLTVIAQFDSPATADQLKRAETGDIDARLAQAQQNMQATNYVKATSSYDTILQLAYCKTDDCQTKVGNLDATAYNNLGQSYVQKKDYQHAVTAFDTVLSNFPNAPIAAQVRTLDATTYYNLGKGQLQSKSYSGAVATFDNLKDHFPDAPEVKQSHGYMSKSLLGDGQQTRASSCRDAVPIYQRLAKEYGDTSEGKTAQSELSAPQTVKGHFTNVESTTPYSQIALIQGLKGDMTQDVIFNDWANASIKTDIDSNGNFTFTDVNQGIYNLIWYANDGSYLHIEFIYSQQSLQPIYSANVGPLCAVNVGEVTNAKVAVPSL